jgi:hypothetical protein
MPPEREGVVRRPGNEGLRWPVMGEERDMRWEREPVEAGDWIRLAVFCFDPLFSLYLYFRNKSIFDHQTIGEV